MLVVEGKLPPDLGALLTRALEAAGQELRCRAGDGSAHASALGARENASAEACSDIVGPGTVGRPLDVGRKTRRINAALWRALRTRDATCRFPGCATTIRLTAHHITHWAAGGPTSKDNTCLLCRRHRWAVHEGGFEVRGCAQDLTFTTPDGIALSASPRPPRISPDPVEVLRARHAAVGLELGPHSNVIWWQGERMDLDWAVEDLRLSSQRDLVREGGQGP